tara:strand:- start:31 stop:300 length:270 start_codon:yes stop_codon:yes gene_type:complete
VVVVVLLVEVLPPDVADTTSDVVVADVIMFPLALMLPCEILGIISTLSTVAPLMNISSEFDSIWNSEPNALSCLFGTITIELILGARAL